MTIKILNATMMIVSTSVGVGVLGLPIATSTAGMLPTLLAFIVVWFFMTLAAFYIVEVKLTFKGQYSLAGLIQLTLGRRGHYLASFVIVLLLYALLSTYLMALVAWIQVIYPPLATYDPAWLSAALLASFVVLIMCRERWLYRVNNLLGIGVFVAFWGMNALHMVPIQKDFLTHMQIQAVWTSFPLLLTTFGFSVVMPAVTEYLEYDRTAVHKALRWGSLVALIMYIIWEWVALGHIPFDGGSNTLAHLKTFGDNGTGVVRALAKVSLHPSVVYWGQLFAVLLLVTSFLGCSLALLHALFDLGRVHERPSYRGVVSIIMYLVPWGVVRFFPTAFVQFLSLSGVFVGILLGIMPVAMISVLKKRGALLPDARYHQGCLIICFMFFIAVVSQEVWSLFGITR